VLAVNGERALAFLEQFFLFQLFHDLLGEFTLNKNQPARKGEKKSTTERNGEAGSF